MEEEIDLREYIAVLIKYRYWIIGLAAVAAVTALVVSFLLPPTYQATALVAVIKPRYAMKFDPRFETLNNVQLPYKAYPVLATGGEVVVTLIDALGESLPPERRSVSDLRSMLEAKNSQDPSMIELTVSARDPEQAALIANRWAEVFVKHANDLYSQSQVERKFFAEQLQEAQETLNEAEKALIEFQSRNEASILSARLNDKKAALNEYLRVARSLRLIVQDAKSLRERLRSQDSTNRAALGDELASLFLEIDALNSEKLPIQLQISGPQSLSDKTVGEQIVFLDSLIQVLDDKRVILEQEADTLKPDILRLQEELQKVRAEERRLNTARQVAQETYVTISRKLAEAKIAAQDPAGEVQLASKAVVPDRPTSPRKLLNTAVAGTLGLFVGILGAFAIEYWQQGKPRAASPNAQ